MTSNTPSADASALTPDYCEAYLPPEVTTELEAGAFRSLFQHLQERSDSVSNMDLMSLSGFCRNCLAKWMVLEARRLVDSSCNGDYSEQTIQALNAFGYDEAARHVYGVTYEEWKQRYQKKATDEQMKRYNESKPIHAVHDKALLSTRAEKPELLTPPSREGTETTSGAGSSTLRSNVCCEDVEKVASQATASETPSAKTMRMVGSFVPPSIPQQLKRPVAIGILTVSDRAFNREYKIGDLSGPAAANAVQELVGKDNVELRFSVVSDDKEAIQNQLTYWCNGGFDLILTTGGTGMSRRDVTPEATRVVLDEESPGMMAFCAMECSRQQPLACLSRGTAGIRGQTIIANLPGNPKGVAEVIPILLPLLLHALVDV